MSAGADNYQPKPWVGMDSPWERLVDRTHLSTSEVCQEVGITYRQLDYWQRKGYVEADVTASGSGTHRGWSPMNVSLVACIADLVEAGYEGDRLKDAVAVLRQSGYFIHKGRYSVFTVRWEA